VERALERTVPDPSTRVDGTYVTTDYRSVKVVLLVFVALAACATPRAESPGGCVVTSARPAQPSMPAEEALKEFRRRLASRFSDLVMGNIAPDAGMHLTDVTDVDVDRDEQVVVSGSDDKTARIWRLSDGRPLHVLRIPGLREKGQIIAVAMSPDGGTVALGGWEGVVYLFRTSDWHLVGAISAMPTILSMRFSPDGRRLAVGLWGRSGVRVFDTDRYRLVFTDRDYGSDCYGLAFSKSGLLAVGSWDGAVRIYASDHRLLAKRHFDQRPFRVAFDPKEEMVLVGFLDGPAARLLAVPSLAVVRELAITPRDPSDTLGTVAWAANGSEFYASGRYDGEDGRNPVLRWQRDGTRLPDWYLHNNTPDQIVALGSGGLLVASQDPLVGVLDSQGAARWVLRPHTIDFSGQSSTLRFSADTSRIQFAWREGDHERLTFDVRALRIIEPNTTALRAAITEAPGFEVASWHNSTKPTLNGRQLPVEARETCRALAIDARHDSLLLGCEWNLYAFAKSGQLLWKQGLGASVRGLSLSEDGRVAVVALDDGTFRWLAREDGRPLLCLFFYQPQQWVAWTPDGFFSGSEFGESLLGIHGLRRDGSADLLPMLDFADVMRRPDLVAHALDRVIATPSTAAAKH